MAWYAFADLISPAAAGFLTGKVSRDTAKLKANESRWSSEHMAGQMYAASKCFIHKKSCQLEDAMDTDSQL